jgi:hypothetical protein
MIFFDRLFLNCSVLGQSVETEAGPNDYNFLIITHPDFEAQANLLAQWKKQKGIKTKVITTDITGGTASEIKSYIEAEYNNFSIDSVLLLGDAEFIPTNYQTTHPYHGIETGTDLYFATVAGADYIPDISIGRIPVDTSAEAETVINKIVNYEKNPVSDPNFYENITVGAYFQDRRKWTPASGWIPPDGYEDRRFVLTSEEIRDFLLAEGYNVDRIYTTEPSITPTNYNNGSYNAGTPLPVELLRANSFPWNGNRTDVSNGISSGRLIVNHRNHGADRNDGYPFTGWGDPYYDHTDISTLTNGELLPLVFSINCETGWFDGETDAYTTRNFESFSELFLLQPAGGAVGVIGSARVSYSGYNDDMAKGFYDAIWPNFMSGYGSGSPIYRMGSVLNYGKIYMSTVRGEGIIRKTEFEEFHYFGDPTMEIWTDIPQDLTVYHDSVIPSDATSYEVEVKQKISEDNYVPLDGALVTLTKDGNIIGTATSSNGVATVDFGGTLPTTGHYDEYIQVTVTKHNYRPYIGRTTVLEPFEHINVADCLGESGFAVTAAIINNLGLIDWTGTLADWSNTTASADCSAINNFVTANPSLFSDDGADYSARNVQTILEHFTGDGDFNWDGQHTLPGEDSSAIGGPFNWAVIENTDVHEVMYAMANWHFINGYGITVPTKGDYKHWITVEIASASAPFAVSGGVDKDKVDIEGFWVDNPGANKDKEFVAANVWIDTNNPYYQPINGKYQAVIEPPAEEGSATLRSSEGLQDASPDIIDAAVAGISEFGLTKNTKFNEAYNDTQPGMPVFVTRTDGGDDYYLVPFMKPDGRVTVVARVKDGDHGKFKGVAYNYNVDGRVEYPIDPTQTTDPLTHYWENGLEHSLYHPIQPDLDENGCIDRADLYIILAEIRGPAPHDSSYDLNGDGAVNIADARKLVTLFTNSRGAACP